MTATQLRSREWRLRQRPTGTPSSADVELVEVALAQPLPGEVLVHNIALSVEPYMWGRMSGEADYAAPYELGVAMTGHAVGTVVASAATDLPVGTLVVHEAGWREAAVVPASAVRALPSDDVVPSAWLGAAGLTGFTAYVGLLDIAACKPGDTVFISAAGGSVGSTVAQIAKLMGCTVIGSAGSAAKVEFLTSELGVDAAFDYHDGVRASLSAALDRVGQSGLDVYFDNVGGDHLESAIRRMRDFGRITLCGAISTYGNRVPGPGNLLLAIWRRLRLQGFIASDHEARRPEFERVMTDWLRQGAVRSVETVRSGGVEVAFDAFLGMLQGQDIGKTVVTLG